ncbi:MAG: tetratricopeptide repeat protein [Candidatus Acidiferrales bacterium]
MRLHLALPSIALLLVAVPGAGQTPTNATRVFAETSQRLKTLTSADILTISQKAQAGDPEAQYWLGQIYEDGHLVTKDEELAREWTSKSADQYFGAAEYAMLRWAGRDPVKEEMWLRRAAEDGEAHAALWLGVAYDQNKFGTTDIVEAAKWYRLAAEQGDPDAEVSLGDLYELGDGVEQDYAKAAEYYRRAAEHVPNLGGAGQGRRSLGQLYMEGLGVPKDYVQGYMWLSLGGDDRIPEYYRSLMTPDQIQRGRLLADEWKKQHPDPVVQAP